MEVRHFTADEILTAMHRAGRAHLSLTRGALPFVVPTGVRLHHEGLVLDSLHPSVLLGASRGDIAAVQVDLAAGAALWSLLATGPLLHGSLGVLMRRRDAMFSAECLSSPDGDPLDPLV